MMMTRLMYLLRLSLLSPLQLTCSPASLASLKVRAVCLTWPSLCPVTDFSTATSLHLVHHLTVASLGLYLVLSPTLPTSSYLLLELISFFLIMIYLSFPLSCLSPSPGVGVLWQSSPLSTAWVEISWPR